MSVQDNDTAIRALIENWRQAICSGDLDRVTAAHAVDIVLFDVPAPIQEIGIDAYRQSWELFFAHTAPGPERFRIDDLRVASGDHVAFAHGLLSIGAGPGHARCRLTLGLRKRNTRWEVTHEHHSMPVRLA